MAQDYRMEDVAPNILNEFNPKQLWAFVEGTSVLGYLFLETASGICRRAYDEGLLFYSRVMLKSTCAEVVF